MVNPLGIDPAITTGQYSGNQTKKGPTMKKELLLALVCTAATLPAVAQNKIDNRLGDSALVLKQMLAQENGIPQNLLDKAACVLVFPAVKKVGVGIGVTYGRGVIVCR